MRDSAELRYFLPHFHLTPFLVLTTLLSLFFFNFYEIFGEFLRFYGGGDPIFSCRPQPPVETTVGLTTLYSGDCCLDRGPSTSSQPPFSNDGCSRRPACPGQPPVLFGGCTNRAKKPATGDCRVSNGGGGIVLQKLCNWYLFLKIRREKYKKKSHWRVM
jgi:hypothetical protein